ncbi:thioredoxin-like protein [Chaetomium sp. MPI-CAGE-AT-0009]|nr:thioredoxin-like protein [Chaetomium sp. MPI-CAGE-AT-0009]
MAEAVQVIGSLEALNELTAANKYVVIDFTATWCPPCKAIAPMYQKLATEHAVENRLAFAKVDVDEAQEVAQKFEVSAMPTFLFLVDGEPSGIDVGGAEGPLAGKPTVLRAKDSGPDGPLVGIRGADPRSLVEAVNKVAELAKAEAGQSA